MDESLLREVVAMYADLQIYGAHLELPVLHATEKYYHLAADQRLTQNGMEIIQYLKYVETKLAEERARLDSYLNPAAIPSSNNGMSTPTLPTSSAKESTQILSGTAKPLIHAIEKELIALHVDAILGRALNLMMDRIVMDSNTSDTTVLSVDAIADLKRLYVLLKRVGALEKLRTAFMAYVKRVGGEIISKGEKNDQLDETMIRDVLVLKWRIDHILMDAFGVPPLAPAALVSSASQPESSPSKKNQQSNKGPGDDAFWTEKYQYALKESFESFMNLRHNKPAELLSRFMDSLLKAGGLKKLILPSELTSKPSIAFGVSSSSGSEIENVLQHLLVLFRYLSSKDVFEAFYKKDLARRLLLNKSASVDLEKSILSALKVECGVGFVSKLEGMFRDLEVSAEIMRGFKDSKMGMELRSFDMNVHILTQGYWPTYSIFNITLPDEMLMYQETFKKYYASKYPNRQLQWQNNLGQCVLRSNFPHGSKELVVSLFQSTILLLFNAVLDRQSLTYRALRDMTQLQDDELKRTLQSLACGKIRVLVKTPKGKDVNETDTFEVNLGFRNDRHRIKINEIQARVTPDETKQTHEEVQQDRQYQIDATIVRIMKSKRRMDHQSLFHETVQVCAQKHRGGFVVTSADFKKRVENLMEREFLERDKTDTSLYHYMA